MQNKYSWSNVPKEVEWIATDPTGFKHGYTSEPAIDLDYKFWDGYGCIQLGCSEFQGYWKDSLEERPNDL